MTVWMEVTRDEFELPVAIADTCYELARKVGAKDASRIQSLIINAKKHGYRCKYVKVEIDEE